MKYTFSPGEDIPAESFQTLDPDNLVEQSPAKLIGGDDVVLSNFQALDATKEVGSLEYIDKRACDTIHLRDNIFFSFYYEYNNQVGVCLLRVNDDKTITRIKNQYFSHNIYYPIGRAIKIDDNRVILFWNKYSSGAVGSFAVFNIDSNNNITMISNLLDVENMGYDPSFIKLKDNYYVAVGRRYTTTNNLAIININSNNITAVKTLSVSVVSTEGNSLARIDDNHFLLSSADGLSVYNVDVEYNMTKIYDCLEASSYNSLVELGNNKFALACKNSSNQDVIKVFKINSSYNIIKIDEVLHSDYSSDIITNRRLFKMTDDTLVLACAGNSNYGRLYLFNIRDDWTISEFMKINHENGISMNNTLDKMNNSTLLLSFNNNSTGTEAKTFQILPAGSFKATIDDIVYDNVNVFLPATITEDDIANSVQSAIRAKTSKEETVEWNTDHFEIKSSITGKNNGSQVLKLQPPITGTDISGAGYLDLGANATEVAGDGDDYKLVRLDEDGQIPRNKLKKVISTCPEGYDIMFYDPQAYSTDNTSFVKIFSLKFNKTGNYRIKCWGWGSWSSATGYIELRNGASVLLSRSFTGSDKLSTTSPPFLNDLFIIQAGTTIDIYIKSGSSDRTAFIGEFTVQASHFITPTIERI